MSQLLAFTNYIKDRRYAADDFDRFAEIIEPIDLDGRQGYRLKPLEQADKITQKCKVLVEYTWHCRDYVKKILRENGIANDGEIVNSYIRASRDTQVISYLVNAYKHAGADKSQKWAVELEPRWDKPYVRGMLLEFPHRMKPTVMLWGDSLPGFEFAGSAGIGDDAYSFTGFTWTFSCTVVDKDGKPLGAAVQLSETVFRIWMQILGDNGIAVNSCSTAEFV